MYTNTKFLNKMVNNLLVYSKVASHILPNKKIILYLRNVHK